MRTVAISPKLIRSVALLVILLGFGLRLYALDRESLWYDELLQLDISQGALGTILPALPQHAALPLDYFITHFWVLGGRQEFWVRLPAALLGTLTLPLAFYLGRMLLGRPAALLFMLLLTLSPFHLHYSQEVRPYALLVLGVVLAAIALWRLRLTGRWRYLGLLFSGGLIFSLAHFFATTLFAPWALLAGADLLVSRARRCPALTLAGLVATGAVVLVLLLLLGWGQTLVRVSDRLGQSVAEPQAFTIAPGEGNNQGLAPRVDGRFVRNLVLAPLGAGSGGLSLWLFNGLAGLGLLTLLQQQRFRLAAWLVLWLGLPVVFVVIFLVHRDEFFASRYIIGVLPAYLLLVTAGLLALPAWLSRRGLRWPAALLFVGLVTLLIWPTGQEIQRYYRVQEKEDWRQVTEVISRNAGPADAVIAVNAEPTMNWYYPAATVPINRYDTLENIEAAVIAAPRSWVIMSIFTEYMGARSEIIRAWLSERGAIRLPLDPLISIYYLGPDASPDQLLAEIQGFALPVNHRLYASLARENRRRPEVARRYFELAIAHAPDAATRAQYEADLAALVR